MTGLFFHSDGNVIFPTDELIFFRGIETTNQLRLAASRANVRCVSEFVSDWDELRANFIIDHDRASLVRHLFALESLVWI